MCMNNSCIINTAIFNKNINWCLWRQLPILEADRKVSEWSSFLKHMIRLDTWSPHYRKAYPVISPDILGWAWMGLGNITTFDIQYAAMYAICKGIEWCLCNRALSIEDSHKCRVNTEYFLFWLHWSHVIHLYTNTLHTNTNCPGEAGGGDLKEHVTSSLQALFLALCLWLFPNQALIP